MQQIAKEPTASKQVRLPWWGVLCVIVGGLVVMFLFDHFGRLTLARPTLYSAGVIAVALMTQWKLRRHVWFWITMTLIVALHVPLILLVPWTTKWVPAFMIAPLAVADFCAMLAIVSVVGKFVAGSEPTEH